MDAKQQTSKPAVSDSPGTKINKIYFNILH